MKTTDTNNPKKNAVILAILFLIMALLCILYLFFWKQPYSKITAEIYQDGKLLETIPLSDLQAPYMLTLTGENGGTNVVEARPGSIGIVSADCPDKLCVNQGFIKNSLLPITCLPNRVVIQITEETISVGINGEDSTTPDIITY